MDTSDQRLKDLQWYLWQMRKDNRLVETPRWFCGYFIVEAFREIASLHNRPYFTVPLDKFYGEICYIDKILVLKRWRKSDFMFLQDEIVARHPQLRWACWYRPNGDYPDRFIVYNIRRRRYAEVPDYRR